MGVAAAFVYAGEVGDGTPPRAPRHRSGENPEDTGIGRFAGRRLTVLLVEDDAAMRLVCRVNLEAAGYAVVIATTGSEAIERAREVEPDVVLLDVMLPDVGGFEVARQVGGAPVVFLSARVSEVDIERGRTAGAIDYVTKPFDPLRLPRRLREDLEELRRNGSSSVWRMRFGIPQDERD
ncbi:MAG: response regulator [Actinobacteria bacterium]|nr:response regulator [Actinomycetota bacterium]MBV8599675.1 response regulator [Actinomycetota bacterium]